MIDMNACIRTAMEAAQEAGGATTVSHSRKAMGVGTTTTREVLAEAVAKGVMRVKKFFHAESIFELTGLPLPDVEASQEMLSVSFEDLLVAWNMPMVAPKGKPGRVHRAFS